MREPCFFVMSMQAAWSAIPTEGSVLELRLGSLPVVCLAKVPRNILTTRTVRKLARG